jgi:hypothetical protein
MTRLLPHDITRSVRLALLALMLLASSPAALIAAAPVEPLTTPIATTEPAAGIPIPVTPAGKQLAWLVHHINTDGARNLSTRDLRSHVAPGLPQLRARPAAPGDHPRLRRAERAPGRRPLRGRRHRDPCQRRPDRPGRPGLADPPRRRAGRAPPDRPALLRAIVLPTSVADPPEGWAELDDQLERLAPGVSFVAAEVTGGDCAPIHAYRAEESLGVASSFKLYVLGELTRQLASGEIAWDELVAIDPSLVSLRAATSASSPPAPSCRSGPTPSR